MIQTKLGDYRVMGEPCALHRRLSLLASGKDSSEYSHLPFISNSDRERCDICGEIHDRVTYDDVRTLRRKDFPLNGGVRDYRR